MKVVIAILAKMGSKRLPNKLLQDIAGKPAIERLIEGALQSRDADEVVLATADLPENEVLERIAKKYSIACFKGSEVDTLDRLYKAARAHKADALLRLTGDNVLVDPEVVDTLIREYKKRYPQIVFATTCLPPTFPEGFSMEIVETDTLKKLHEELTETSARATFMIYLALHPERFPRYTVSYKKDVSRMRLTMDYADDLELIRQVYAFLTATKQPVRIDAIVEFLEKHPELVKMNQHHMDRTKYPFAFGKEAVTKAM